MTPYRLPHPTPREPGEEAIKRSYRKLLHRWVAPIVHDPEAERAKRERQAAALAAQRKLSQKASAAERASLEKRRAVDAAVQPGEKGFRKHAYIPAAAKLDYVHNPGKAPAGGHSGQSGGRRRDDEDEDDDGGFGAMAAVAREPGARRGGGGGGGGGGADLDPLTRRMRDASRLKKNSTARAAKVSVEGRNIAMM